MCDVISAEPLLILSPFFIVSGAIFKYRVGNLKVKHAVQNQKGSHYPVNNFMISYLIFTIGNGNSGHATSSKRGRSKRFTT